MRRLIISALIAAMTAVALVSAQGNGPIASLVGLTDDSLNLKVISVTTSGGTDSTPRAIGSLLGRTDANRNLYVTLADGSVIVAPIFTAPVTINRASIGTTSADGLVVQNVTPAISGGQQYSPRSCWSGTGWKTDNTAGSQTVKICQETRTVQGAAAPAAHLMWTVSVNGGAFTDMMALSNATSTVTVASTGQLNVPNVLVQGTQLNIGASTALRSSSNGSQLTFPADGEVNILANGVARNAAMRSAVIVEANTTTKAPTALENDEYYTNTGDGDGSAITLLNDPTVGTRYNVAVTAAQTITVTASSGETLKFGATSCGTSLTSNVVGSTASFLAATGGSGAIWVTTSTVGTWVCTP